MTDALNHTTTSAYNGDSELTKTTDPLGQVTSYAFDSAGNRTLLTDPDGNTTTWAYDVLERPVGETTPTGGHTSQAHNGVGDVTSATDADGRRIGYSYDSDDRMTGETWYSAAGATLQLETWSYDAVGNMLTAQAPGGAYTFAYDADNRLTVVQEPFGLTLTMGYDTAGNRTSVHDSQGGYTTVTFNSLNEVTDTALSGSGITPVQQLESYDADGEVSVVTRETYTGGVWVTAGTTSYAYDSVGRTTQLTDFTGAGTVLASLVYAYNAGGLVTSETDDGSQRTYAYDAGNESTDDGGTVYSYDSNGNRNSTGYVVGTGNQVTTDGTTTYSYDAAGNVTQTIVGASGATWTYAYDNSERLVGASYSATLGGKVTTMVTYIYDAFGNRIEEDTWVSGSGTTVTRFGVDGWNTTQPAPVGDENYNDVIDLNGSNAVVDRRMWGPGVDQPVVREDASGNAGWYLTDEMGDVMGVTNGSGTPLTTITYDGFGNVLSNSTPAQSDRYLKAGSQWDGALGLWDNNQRVTNGKFWYQPDPIFPEADPTNPYRVVGNDSVNATDPSGLYNAKKVYNALSPAQQERAKELEKHGWGLYDERKPPDNWIAKDIPSLFSAGFQDDVTIRVNVTNEKMLKMLLTGAGVDIQWRHDSWAVDFTHKQIWLDWGWGTDPQAALLGEIIDALHAAGVASNWKSYDVDLLGSTEKDEKKRIHPTQGTAESIYENWSGSVKGGKIPGLLGTDPDKLTVMKELRGWSIKQRRRAIMILTIDHNIGWGAVESLLGVATSGNIGKAKNLLDVIRLSNESKELNKATDAK